VPVRWRLTLAFAAVIAVVLAATGIFVHGRLATSLDAAVNRGLNARAADVAALARESDTGLKEARAAGSGRRVELAQLIDRSGHVLDRTPGLAAQPLLSRRQLAATQAGRRVRTDAELAGDEHVRLLAEPVRAQEQALVVVVGQSLEDRDQALANLTDVLLLGGPAALLLASLAGYLLTGAALRPVERMRRRAAALSATNLGERLPAGGGNDELGRLGRTLNELLARVHDAVARERAFVSDASHELRSPLAVLRTELELIARDRPSGGALQEAVASAVEETDRLRRLADDLLMLARADDERLTVRPEPLVAAELLDAAAARARATTAPATPQISAHAPPGLRVLADRDRVEQALANLVSNALRHGGGGDVRLEARDAGARVELHVLDDGPGFAPAFLPRAWERFARGDPARTEDGAGLGLAIVRTIAELHGGDAQAANRPGGGADVWIALPSALTPADAPPRDQDRAGSRARRRASAAPRCAARAARRARRR
jgi:two-component system OmpR family sensor kinase